MSVEMELRRIAKTPFTSVKDLAILSPSAKLVITCQPGYREGCTMSIRPILHLGQQVPALRLYMRQDNRWMTLPTVNTDMVGGR